ncbi:MAG: type 4a pilus biogenesis protein PilO [Candidatus Colwellbacteria bacterium]|nr:type 4a pilus biogenesis protein PilO [Candidatus Colwellbacteria bacterium]
MTRDFRKRLTISVAVAAGITVALLLLLSLVGRDIQAQASNIKSAKDGLKTRVQQLNDLARLREEAKLAEPNLAKLKQAVPQRDELFSVRRELEQLAGNNNLAASFTFGSENPKEGSLGSINFEFKIQGGEYEVGSFINQVESRYPFVRINSLDMVRQENKFSSALRGKILFNE